MESSLLLIMLLIPEILFLAIHLYVFSVSSLQFFQDLAGKPSGQEFVKGKFNSYYLFLGLLVVHFFFGCIYNYYLH